MEQEIEGEPFSGELLPALGNRKGDFQEIIRE